MNESQLSPISFSPSFSLLEYIFFRDDIGLRARASALSWGWRTRRRGWVEGRYNAGLSRESTFLDTSPLSHCPPPNARTKDSEDEKFNSAFKLFSPASPFPPPRSEPAGRLSRTGRKKITSVTSPVVQPPRLQGRSTPHNRNEIHSFPRA